MVGPVYKLHPAEFGDYFKHLTRLDEPSRRERFKGSSDDAALQSHALRLAISETLVIGVRLDGELRASAELMPSANGQTATAAVLVEPLYRGHGLGRKLLEEAILMSRPLGIKSFLFDVRPTNQAMIHLITALGGTPTSQAGLFALNIDRRAAERRTPAEISAAQVAAKTA